jgi:hypothetical protein
LSPPWRPSTGKARCTHTSRTTWDLNTIPCWLFTVVYAVCLCFLWETPWRPRTQGARANGCLPVSGLVYLDRNMIREFGFPRGRSDDHRLRSIALWFLIVPWSRYP